jgi:hypothetical protein
MATTLSQQEPVEQIENAVITRRLLGSSAIVSQSPGERDISVTLDIEGFVRRLLMFDTYVLYSVRLKEIPEMVRHFGFQGTLDLLSSGALEIRCECIQFMEGQYKTPECPPLTFQFHLIEAHVWEQYLIHCLPALSQAPALSTRELRELQGAVVKAVKHSDNRQMFATEVSPAFERELLGNDRLVKAAVMFVLSKDYGNMGNLDFEMKIHRVGDDARYRVETNLPTKLGLDPGKIHNKIKTALLGISGLCQRIGEMKAHVALSGFTDEEVPLFRAKLGSLADVMGANKQEEQFQRIVSISGLPAILPAQQINIEKLLQIREEPEAIEFRGWLAEINKLNDAQIRDLVSSFNAKLGLAVQTTAGKGLRLLVTAVAGLNPLAGLIAGSLDQFMWDKFFRRSGVAAFINELYPTIFKNQ